MFSGKFSGLIILLLVSMVFIVPVSACLHIFHPDPPSSIEWELNSSGSGSEKGYDIHGTCDGGYILVGTSGTTDEGSTNILVRKLDANRNTVWQRVIGGNGRSEGRTIRKTADGGYLIVGMTTADGGDFKEPNHGGWDVVAGKISPAGALEWVRKYGGSGDDFGENIRPTKNGAVIIGRTFSNDGDVSSQANYSIVTKKGESEKPVREFNNTVVLSANSSDEELLAYFMGDTIRETQTGQSDVWIIEIDPHGNILWQQRYGGSKDDYGYDIIPLDDDYLFFTGTTFSNDGDIAGKNFGEDVGSSDGWVVRLKPDHSVDWQDCLGGSDNEGFFSIEPALYATVRSGCGGVNLSVVHSYPNGYTLAGFAGSKDGDVFPRPMNNHESYDGWIVKVNPELLDEWSRCIGGSEFDIITSSSQTNIDKYIFSGFTLSTNGDLSRPASSRAPAVPFIGLYNVDDVNIDWVQFPGNNETGLLNSVEIRPDGDYLTVGWMNSQTGSNRTDLYIARLSGPSPQPKILTLTPPPKHEGPVACTPTSVQVPVTERNPNASETVAESSPVTSPPTTTASILGFLPVVALICIVCIVIRFRKRNY